MKKKKKDIRKYPLLVNFNILIDNESVISEFTFNGDNKSSESWNDDSEAWVQTNIVTYESERIKSIWNLTPKQPKKFWYQITLFRLKQLWTKIEDSIKQM